MPSTTRRAFLAALPLLGGAALAACDRSPAGLSPRATPSPGQAAAPDARVHAGGISLPRFPDRLRLSDAQVARLGALVGAYETANRADIDALAAIEHEAAAALRLGKPRAEVWAIMARAGQPRGRLAPAAGRTVAEMRAALTPAQRAWLDAQRPTLPAAGARQ